MRADFYYIADKEPWHFACRIIDKAYQNQRQLYAHTACQADASQLDDLLWTFQQHSFIPHGLVDQYLNNPPAIEIGFSEPPPHQQDIILNLSSALPKFINCFQRVIEIVLNDQSNQAQNHLQYYKNRGDDINHYHLTK